MLEDQIKKRWTAYGRKLERDKEGNIQPSVDDNTPFDINELLHNIDMGDKTKGPYGIPISTNVATLLIRNMLDALNDIGIQLATKPISDNDEIASTEKKAPIVNSIVDKLILNSMGVTFDKSQLLRIISQPNCEGVRFYHALKKDKDGNDDCVTLVCVGVSKDGYDLNYKKFADKDVTSKQDNTCESLVDDWGHPPGGGIAEENLIDKKTNERYVLWRLAEGMR